MEIHVYVCTLYAALQNCKWAYDDPKYCKRQLLVSVSSFYPSLWHNNVNNTGPSGYPPFTVNQMFQEVSSFKVLI